MSIYGELDTANESLKRVVVTVHEDWKSGKVRYWKEDIERVRQFVREVNRSSLAIRKIMECFDTIVLPKDSVIIEPLLNKSKEPNGIPR